MAISTKDFATLVSDQVTAIQGAASQLVDTRIGSILRSLVEANAAVVLWLQGIVLTLLSTSRAATSSGADLDSWVGDYGLTRLPAVAATGAVTFSRFTPTAQAVVPIGSLVQTTDGSQRFIVTIDTGNSAYNSGLGGYVMAIGISSVIVPVAAQVAGYAGNAAAGIITTLTQTIAGVDSVTNALQFTNGADAESDTALRARFVNYINSLARATKAAVKNAAQSVAANLTALVIENTNYSGGAQLGYFTVVVDDGSGNPPSGTLLAAYAAVDAVRPMGSSFGVFPPTIVTANITIAVTVAAGYDTTGTRALVQTAITAYVNALPLGATLYLARLTQVAYDATTGVANVTASTINGNAADLTASTVSVIKAGSVVVS
jgi:uncharacterized phage protein gp47/JayE